MYHNKRTRTGTRVVAFLLSCVLTLTLLPTEALAVPGESGGDTGGVPVGFVLTRDSGKDRLEYSRFVSNFTAELAQHRNALMNGFDDTSGIHYNGLNNSSPTPAMIAEYLAYYLVDCWWADSNMCYNSSNKTYYNAFSATGGGVTDLYAKSQVNNDLKAFRDAIVNKFTDTTTTWRDGPFTAGLLEAVNMTTSSGNFYDDTSTSLKPGTGSYQNAVQMIMLRYVEPNIASVLATKYLSEEEVTAALNGTNSIRVGSVRILNEIKRQLADGTLQEGGHTGTTAAGAGAGSGAGSDAGGETTLPDSTPTVETEFKWPSSVDLSHSLIIGDSAVIKMAFDNGWVDDSYWTENSLVRDYELYLRPDTNHPGIVAHDFRGGYADTSSPQLTEANHNNRLSGVSINSTSGIGDDWAEIYANLKGDKRDENYIEHVYILFGADKAAYDQYSIGNEAFVSDMLAEFEASFSALAAALPPNAKHISVLSIPEIAEGVIDLEGLPVNTSDAANKIVSWNSALSSEIPALLARMQAADTYGSNATSNMYARPLSVTGSYSDMGDFWESNTNEKCVTSAVVAAGKESENLATAPVGTTEQGNDRASLYNLYMENEDALRPFFRILSNVKGHITQRWTAGFADSGSWLAYYKEPYESITTLSSFAMDLYKEGYQQSGFYQNPQPTFQAGDQKPNNDDVARVQSALELLSNAVYEGNDIVIPDKTLDDAELTVIGYTALAAGVVYDPFVSIAGNESYFETVKYMLDGLEESNIDKVERLLHEAYTRKKPVYVIDGSKNAWSNGDSLATAPSGDYRYAHLSDLLQATESVTRVYTVALGGMEPSSVDSSTWVYMQGNSKTSSTTVGADTTIAGVEATDDNVEIKKNSTGGTSTVAGSTLVATSQEMSAPIMFSSGTKTASWNANFEGSASGYAAGLGGLTTMIVHNAAQDAKSNPAVQHPEDYLLFMNGLGDIVLDDGTIVLPAIANPAIYNYDAIQYSVESTWSIAGAILGTAGTALGAIAGGVAITAATAASGGASLIVLIGVCTAGGAAGGAGGLVLGDATNAMLNGSSEDSLAEILNVYDETQAYYPYTAAFMNHYPSVLINTAGKLAVSNTNDTGKYTVGIDSNGNILARPIASLNNKTQANLEYSGGGVTIAPIQGLSFDVTENSRAVGTALPYINGSDGTFSTRFNTARKFDYFMVKDSIFSGDDQAFFPLNDDIADLKDSYLKLSGPLVTSAKRYLLERKPTEDATTHHPTFNVRRYVVDMCGQGLLGTQYAETLQKNYQISYDEMVQDTGNRLLTFFVQLVESAINTLGSIDGVLAIKNGYENKFFNMLVQFIQQFYLLIAVALLAIVAIKFMRGHYNFIFVMFVAALCFCGFELYANWMPTLIPSLYNFAVNDAVEQIAWNTTVVSAESYSETYLDSNRRDTTTGALKPYTATITLYKMTQSDMEDIAGRLQVTPLEIKSGKVIYLDESAGIFVQGDSIKMSVDKLLTNNTMRGLYFTQWEELSSGITSTDDFITPVTNDSDKVGNPYSIQLTQPYVSLEAYYMPYNEIERAFMVNLNAFASVFRFERNQFNYGKNLYKDAFLFNCYTNSGIFTAPGDKEVLRENIKVGSVLGGIDYGTDDDNVQGLLNRIYGGNSIEPLFKYPDDWLNVAAVFRSPSANMKESLWGKMLQDRGWYNWDWEITDPDALGDLVAYINNQTKQFVIKNSAQLNYCSDENAIKLVSLYATTCFTHYVSQFGNWLYPNYLNAADIELKDVLYGSMTTLRDRNIASDGTVVNTVAHKLGVFGVIFLLIITVLATVFVFTVTYLVPVLYALLGIIIVYKLINDQNSLGLVQGYVKVTATTCVLYLIFSLSLRLVEVGGYAWYGYLGCALLMYLCCYFLFWVCLSVVQNVGEMGNDVLGQNLLRGFDNITRGAVRKLTANTLNARRGFQGFGGHRYGYGGYGSPYQYGRGYGIDDRNPLFGSRRAHGLGRGYSGPEYGSYGRGSSYDETMYDRESRRGVSRLVDGMADRFDRAGRSPRRARQTTAERIVQNGDRRERTVIRQMDMGHLDDNH